MYTTEQEIEDFIKEYQSSRIIIETSVRSVLKRAQVFERKFKKPFYKFTKEVGKEQYLVPYLMSSHPGSTLKEAIEKATAENKHIFIECHTDGCVPCKMMKDRVFPHDKVAEYLNREFVSISIGDESDEGARILEKFDVQMFPTYLILEPNGEPAGVIMQTETDFDAFINKIEEVKNSKQ